MKRARLIYRQRLGDIVACLPAARRLAESGYEVEFCCLPRYHSLFEAVGYARPVSPADSVRQEPILIFDLEITRAEYDAYRASGQKWRDYIYGKHPELQPAAAERPLFDRMPDVSAYALPPRYCLAAPFGISQVTRVDLAWFARQCLEISPGPWWVLADRGTPALEWAKPIHAASLAHLPALIAGAEHFVTINSAPNIIAAGVRSSYHQVYEPGFGGQDNYDAPQQIVLHQPPELARTSWRYRVHYWRRRLLGHLGPHEKAP